MSSVWVAHGGQPPDPHDLLVITGADAAALLALFAVSVLYLRGLRRTPAARKPSLGARLAAVGAVALLAGATASPLHRLAEVLVSVHMVQHVLLIAAVAPLLVVARPLPLILRGLPRRVRRGLARGRAAGGVTPPRTRRVWRPLPTGLAFVVTLWVWHAGPLYDAAVRNRWLHGLEHASMLAVALLLWALIRGAAGGAARVERGSAMLLVFAISVPTVFLAVLMTFAPSVWYPSHATATARWGLDPLADQHLAGVLMWVPMSALNVAAILLLLAAWFGEDRSRGEHASRDLSAASG